MLMATDIADASTRSGSLGCGIEPDPWQAELLR